MFDCQTAMGYVWGVAIHGSPPTFSERSHTLPRDANGKFTSTPPKKTRNRQGRMVTVTTVMGDTLDAIADRFGLTASVVLEEILRRHIDVYRMMESFPIMARGKNAMPDPVPVEVEEVGWVEDEES